MCIIVLSGTPEKVENQNCSSFCFFFSYSSFFQPAWCCNVISVAFETVTSSQEIHLGYGPLSFVLA